MKLNKLYIIIYLITGLFAACREEGPPYSFTVSGETMGTTYSVRIDTEKPVSHERRRDLEKKIRKETDRIYRLWSTYVPESEISRFNASYSTEFFRVSEETHSMIQEAFSLSEATDGAFDITIENLTDLWGFRDETGRRVPPRKEEIAQALRKTGFRKIAVSHSMDECHPCIRKQNPDVKIVLNAVHQGYAADRLFGLVKKEGYDSVLCEVGGEMRLGSRRPVVNENWNIGIERPDYEGRRIITHTLSLSDTSVSTSGDYRSWFSHDGVRYGHIIDPRTGYPANTGNASVTVVGPEAWKADALATAFLLMKENEMQKALKSFPDYKVILWVFDESDHDFKIRNFHNLELIPYGKE